MSTQNTDRDWNYFAVTDPYWSVLTDDRFRQANLTADHLRDFYETGEAHVARVFDLIRRFVNADFAPRKALDFGCGVGRLVVPLARRCEMVMGVDVANAMLQLTAEYCTREALKNVHLAMSDDTLTIVPQGFDFIHSFIVFQHIPPERGGPLIRRLVERLQPGGVGALHLTFAGCPVITAPVLPEPLANREHQARNLLGPSFQAAPLQPIMQMNPYNLNTFCQLLQDCGVGRMHVEFTNHGGPCGLFAFFQKQPGGGNLF